VPVLCIAAQEGSEQALKALLDGRANPALACKRGFTAAHDAAFIGRTACLRLLVDAGAQLEAKANSGFTPLHCAAQDGHAERCSLLLAMGIDINARNNYGVTALVMAIGKAPCVRILLPASDLSVTMQQGITRFTTVYSRESWSASSYCCR